MSSTSPASPEHEAGAAGAWRGAVEAEPFPIDGPDGYFFLTPALEQRLDLLHHLVQYSDLLLVIAGPPGCGKSTLLDELIARGGDRWHVCQVEAKPTLTPDELLERLVTGLGLALGEAGVADAMHALESHLESLHRSNQIAVVAIDDADQLSEATAAFVRGLAERWEGFKTRIVMTRRSAREEPENDAEFTHIIDVPPLEADEVERYVKARLERAGLTTGRADARAARALHRASGGNPAALHAHAADLVASHAERAPSAGRSLAPRRSMLRPASLVGGAIVLAGLGYGVALWLQRPGTVPTPTTAPVAAEPGAPPALAPEPPVVAGTESENARLRASGMMAAAPEGDAESPGAEISPAGTAAGSGPATASRAPTPAPERSPPAAPEPILEPAPTVAVTAQPTPTPAPEAAAAPVVEPVVEPPAEPVVEPVVEPIAEPVAQARPTTPEPVPAPAAGPRDGVWLLAQSDDMWVVQLLGSHDPRDVRRYAARHGVASDSAIFTTIHKGRPWHVLVYGQYPSGAAARQAIGKLSAPLRRASPWARTIASVRKSMKVE